MHFIKRMDTNYLALQHSHQHQLHPSHYIQHQFLQWCPVQEVGFEYLMTQDVMFVPKERHWKFQRIRIIRNVRYVVAIPTPTTIWVRLLAPPVLLIPEPSQVVGFVVQLARIMNMEVMSV